MACDRPEPFGVGRRMGLEVVRKVPRISAAQRLFMWQRATCSSILRGREVATSGWRQLAQDSSCPRLCRAAQNTERMNT